MEIVHLSAQQDHPFFAKRYRYIILGILVGLGLFYLFRSCSLDSFSEANYYIGQDTRWRGLHSLMGKERNLSAFNNELLTTIAKQEHFRIRLMVSSNLLQELEQGKLQGMLTTLEPNYLTENHLLFSHPYFLTGPVLIIPSTAPMHGWNEKRKKIIGIQNHSPIFQSLEQDPSIQLKIYDDILSALTDLSARRIDGVIFPALPAYTYTQTFYKNELKIVTSPLTGEGIRLATLKNAAGEELIKNFNEGLKILKEKGTYTEMLERWSLINTEQNMPKEQNAPSEEQSPYTEENSKIGISAWSKSKNYSLS